MSCSRRGTLTRIQREVLHLLAEGHVMTIDRWNFASIGDRSVATETRWFLTGKRYVTRKDKTKAVETKGNGFVITEKGRRALALNPVPKRRGPSAIKLAEKPCPACKMVRRIEEFVTIYGYPNKRGKYCDKCFTNRQQEQAISFLEGRDFCLYCGVGIDRMYDWTPDGRIRCTHLHLDHMDPLSRGGEDGESNTVYCCPSCNHRKRNKLFAVWLEELEPQYRRLSREVYVAKHGREPEEFVPLTVT